jgi:hypothetical protein
LVALVSLSAAARVLKNSETRGETFLQSIKQTSREPLLSGFPGEDTLIFFIEGLSKPICVKGIPDVLKPSCTNDGRRPQYDLQLDWCYAWRVLGRYRIELKRRERRHEATTSRLFLKRIGIDEAILEQVADRLLQNSAINYTAFRRFCGASDLRTSSSSFDCWTLWPIPLHQYLWTRTPNILIPSSPAWWTTATAIGTNSSLQ